MWRPNTHTSLMEHTAKKQHVHVCETACPPRIMLFQQCVIVYTAITLAASWTWMEIHVFGIRALYTEREITVRRLTFSDHFMLLFDQKDCLVCYYVWAIIYTLHLSIWVTWYIHVYMIIINVRSKSSNGKTRLLHVHVCSDKFAEHTCIWVIISNFDTCIYIPV